MRHVAERVLGAVRALDLVARWGGEEFVVLAPGADAGPGHQLAERIRAAVGMQLLPTVGSGISISVGVANATIAEPLDAVFKRADEALYSAKRAGRNRVAAA